MAHIFWVTCPGCKGRFYCHTEMRHTEWKPRCPYCDLEFDQKDSPKIEE